MSTENRWLALALICMGICIYLLYSINFVKAQGHQHPPEHAELHNRFYQNWFQPSNRSALCCNEKDCSPAASKFEDGKWYAFRAGEWIAIPNEKIETERDSPDGRSHLCADKFLGGWYVYCFLPASAS